MGNATGPQRFALEHVRQLEEFWPQVRDGDPEGVHQARVATRRIRAALPLTWGLPEGVPDMFRSLGKRLGRARELDVTSALLTDLELRLPNAAAAIGALREEIEPRRQRVRRRLIKALDGINVRALGRAIASAPRGTARVTRIWHPWERALRGEVQRRAADVGHAIDRASGVLIPRRLHDLRIATKKLRYAMEIGLTSGVLRNGVALQTLKRVQDVLGQLHDRQVLARCLKRASLDAAGLREGATILDSVLSMESSRLHGKYLRLREELVACLSNGRRISVQRSAA